MENNYLPILISEETKLIDALKAMGSTFTEYSYYHLPWYFKEKEDGDLEVCNFDRLPNGVKRDIEDAK